MALKERGRRYPLTRRVIEPSEEVNLLTRESERLARENKNLTKSLQTQSAELEEVKKKLKKRESSTRSRVDDDPVSNPIISSPQPDNLRPVSTAGRRRNVLNTRSPH